MNNTGSASRGSCPLEPVSNSAGGDYGPGGSSLAVILGLLAGFAAVGSSAAAVVLPALSGDMGIATVTSAWVISGFSLTYGVSMAVYGRIADLVGLRAPLAVGALMMAVGALVAAIAPSFGVLMLGRLVQGAGGAAIPVLAMAVLSSQYQGRLRAQALGLATGVSAAGACLGPLIGGILDELFTWRAAIALPAAGLALVPLVWRRVPTGGTGARLDILGAVLVAASAAGVVLLVQSASTGRVVAVTGGLLLLMGVPGIVFRVRRVPDGFLPKAVVTDGTVARAALAATAVPVAWFALLVAVPIALTARGWQPLQIGLALLPSAASGLAAPRLTAPLLRRLGHARSLSLSGGIAAVALLTASAGDAAGVPALLVLGVMLVTTAFGLCQPAMVAAISAAVAPEVRGVALGIAIMTFFVGGGVGAAVIGGFGEILGTAACLLLLTVAPILGGLVVWPRARR